MKNPIAFKIPYLGQYVTCYLIQTKNFNIFIDCALQKAAEELLPYLEANKKNIVLLTHGHWDHIGGSKCIKQYGGEIYANQDDLPWMTDFQLHWKIGFGQFSQDVDIQPERKEVFWREIGEPLVPDHYLQEGDVLHFDDLTIQVKALPGHSKGSLGYFFEDTGMLFTGDALMGMGFFEGLPQYYNYKVYCESMKKILKICPQIIYTAHTQPYQKEEAIKTAKDAIVFVDKIQNDLKNYLQEDPKQVSVGNAARYVCARERKKIGCGACITVLNHLALLTDSNIDSRIDFSQYICNM